MRPRLAQFFLITFELKLNSRILFNKQQRWCTAKNCFSNLRKFFAVFVEFTLLARFGYFETVENIFRLIYQSLTLSTPQKFGGNFIQSNL